MFQVEHSNLLRSTVFIWKSWTLLTVIWMMKVLAEPNVEIFFSSYRQIVDYEYFFVQG
jgi:hypothetical protein